MTRRDIKIRKQHSVCDGKENLRVQGSPRTAARGSPPTGTTTGGGGEVEVDSAIVSRVSSSQDQPSYIYPTSPGDNHLGTVKAPYNKANSYPPNYNSNIFSLSVEQPPPSAPPGGNNMEYTLYVASSPPGGCGTIGESKQ
eukprot:sb/3474328/